MLYVVNGIYVMITIIYGIQEINVCYRRIYKEQVTIGIYLDLFQSSAKHLTEDIWESLGEARMYMALQHKELCNKMAKAAIDLAETNALTLGLELP